MLQWLVEAASSSPAFSAYFLCNLHLEQLQLDELYAVLRDCKAGEISDEEAIKRLERSPAWVWTAMDPKRKVLVVVDVGSRTLAMAQRVVHQVTQVLARDCVPLLLTDGLKEDYGTALLTDFGHWMHPARRQAKGPRPKPRWMPLPELLYAQVVKSYRPAHRGCPAPRGLRHPAGHRAGLGGVWLDDQHRLCGTAQPGPPSARGGHRTPGQHALPGGSGLAGSAGAVPDVPQLCGAPCELTPALTGTRATHSPG